MKILGEQQLRHPIESLKPVVQVDELLAAIDGIRQVYVSPAIQRYIIDLVGRTRQSGDVYLGASPRGSLALFRAGQARAALNGRDYVLPDDIKALAVAVLGHRIIVSPAARLRELSADRIVQEVIYSTPVPGGDYQASAENARDNAKESTKENAEESVKEVKEKENAK
jgi:MoxR-like ATPase